MNNSQTRPRVVLAGGSGFLGLALAAAYEKSGWSATILSRSRPQDFDWQPWDAQQPGDWQNCLEGADALVNMCGSRIDVALSPANRQQLRESRLRPTQLLGQTLQQLSIPPAVWLQASAIGYYGDAGSAICTEASPAGKNFYSMLCQDWEECYKNYCPATTRQLTMRIGIVLAAHDGMLNRLASLTRAFLGSQISNGRQGISWVALADLCNMFVQLTAGDTDGVYNCCAPNPVSNAEFMRQLRGQLGRPWAPPVPALALKLLAPLMNTEADLVLGGAYVHPGRWLEEGRPIEFPDLAGFLEQEYS